MGGPYFTNAGTFLIKTLFDIYILAVMLRFLLQLVRANFYNPISQFVVAATNPVLRLLRQWVPGLGGLDLAAVLLILVLQFIELWLIYSIGGYAISFPGLLVLSIAEGVRLAVYVFLVAVFVRALLSWIAPGSYNALTSVVGSLSEPLLKPARRLIPPIGGLDLSPIAVLIVLQLGLMLLIAPLYDLGRGLL